MKQKQKKINKNIPKLPLTKSKDKISFIFEFSFVSNLKK